MYLVYITSPSKVYRAFSRHSSITFSFHLMWQIRHWQKTNCPPLRHGRDDYSKNQKKLDTWKIVIIILKFEQFVFYHLFVCPKVAETVANSPDRTSPSGAVWSGSILFAQTFISKYLRSWGVSCDQYFQPLVISYFLCHHPLNLSNQGKA